MDLGIIVAVIVLIVWGVGALVMQGPGWIHLLLTVGVSLLIYRIAVRTSGDTREPPGR
jgi:threonine/homoserine/homoserine lactone efflux protein